MKTKKAKRRLSKGEIQLGGFLVKNEEAFIKISDSAGYMTHRVSKFLNIGRMLDMALDEKQTKFLEDYCALAWVFSNVMPDTQFFLDIDRACVDCLNRHKDYYGIKEDISHDEDRKIIMEQKDLNDEIEKLKNEPDEAEEGE